jgi:hypothetical protein
MYTCSQFLAVVYQGFPVGSVSSAPLCCRQEEVDRQRAIGISIDDWVIFDDSSSDESDDDDQDIDDDGNGNQDGGGSKLTTKSGSRVSGTMRTCSHCGQQQVGHS